LKGSLAIIKCFRLQRGQKGGEGGLYTGYDCWTIFFSYHNDHSSHMESGLYRKKTSWKIKNQLQRTFWLSILWLVLFKEQFSEPMYDPFFNFKDLVSYICLKGHFVFFSSRENSWHFMTPLISFPMEWRLRNKCRNSILMTRHYLDLGSTSDWFKQISHAAWLIKSATHIWAFYLTPFLLKPKNVFKGGLIIQ